MIINGPRLVFGALLIAGTCSIGGCVTYAPNPAPTSTTTTESTTTTQPPSMAIPPGGTTTTQTSPSP
jgi:hypothetical protein